MVRWTDAPFALAVLAALLGPRVARADEVHELRHDLPVDVAVSLTATALAIGAEVGKADLGASTCRWCEDNPLDRGVRDVARWRSPHTAAQLSDAVGLLVAPATAFGTLSGAGDASGAGTKMAVDAILLYEALSLSALANQVVKLSVGRERPFVHALPAADKAGVPHASDNHLSFYSGHTGLTMTLATAGGTIATLRGYRLAPLVWGSGAAISAVTGYLRIAADEHWLTDVLAGAAIGAAIGVLVPVVFHGRRDEGASPSAAPSTPATASITGSF